MTRVRELYKVVDQRGFKKTQLEYSSGEGKSGVGGCRVMDRLMEIKNSWHGEEQWATYCGGLGMELC